MLLCHMCLCVFVYVCVHMCMHVCVFVCIYIVFIEDYEAFEQ